MFKAKNNNQHKSLIIPPAQCKLFVSEVLDFSSQYGQEASYAYTVGNIRSRPENFPSYGDFQQSCLLVCSNIKELFI
jgi:hypothetical protein